MIGPVLQGVLFVSVIYWYTKGMLTLINDYYRDEFKTHINKDIDKEQPKDKLDEISLDNFGSCPSTPVEGLPDLLKSSNDFTKPDGIVVRNIDNNVDKPLMKTEQCGLKSITKSIDDTSGEIKTVKGEVKPDSVEGKVQSDNSGKVYDCDQSSPFDPERNQLHANCHLATGSIKSIRNPSEAGQSNYRQMANRQTSEAAVYTSTTTTTTGEIAEGISSDSSPNHGNCFDDRTENAENFDEIKSKSKDNTVPKICVNGVLVPAQVLKQRLSEKLNKKDSEDVKSCRRRSVNEMVHFWNGFLEEKESELSMTATLTTTTTTGQRQLSQQEFRPVTTTSTATRRCKSNGDIISPNS